jgi:excisionase family DNA binding protein
VETVTEKHFLTVPEAAEYLSVGVSMLNEQIRLGRVPSLKLAGRRLIPKAQLDRWVEEQVAKNRKG